MKCIVIKHNYSEECHKCKLTFSFLIVTMGRDYGALISDKGFVIHFVTISANYSNGLIHLLSLIYCFNAAISIHKRFSLTYFEDFSASNSDCLWKPQLVFLLYIILDKVFIYLKLFLHHLILQLFLPSMNYEGYVLIALTTNQKVAAIIFSY